MMNPRGGNANGGLGSPSYRVSFPLLHSALHSFRLFARPIFILLLGSRVSCSLHILAAADIFT